MFVAAGWLAACATAVRAERLPIASFTTAGGLASDSIRRIVRDSRGYLWICHRFQISRYDGYRFVTYGAEDGLPQSPIHDHLETRDGAYIVATGRGIARFDPAAEGRLFSLPGAQGGPAPPVTALLEDRDGRLWAGATEGLYRVELSGNRAGYAPVALVEEPVRGQGAGFVTSLLLARDGSLWVGAQYGLFRRGPDGRIARYTTREGRPADDVRSLLEDA